MQDFIVVVKTDHSCKLLSFEKIALLYAFWRQADRQTNRWAAPIHQGAFAVASGALIMRRSRSVDNRRCKTDDGRTDDSNWRISALDVDH